MPNNKNIVPSKRSYDDLDLAIATTQQEVAELAQNLRHFETSPAHKSLSASIKDKLRAKSFILNLLDEKRRRMNSQLIVSKYGKLTNYAKHIGASESYTHSLIHEHITNKENETFLAVQKEVEELKSNLK